MATKTTIAIQNLALTGHNKARLFLTVDPAFGIGANSPFVLEGKIRSVSLGINENMGTTVLEFPGRPFGSHTGLVIPIAVYLESSDNMVFRGFILDEEGSISVSDDQLSVIAHDYKWLLSRITKIRGKIYTVDNDVIPDALIDGASRVFSDDSLYEKFRMAVPEDPNEFGFSIGNKKGGTGYIGTMKTVFNENNDPDCASDHPEARAAFKFDPDIDYYRIVNPRRQRNEKFFWNYATMLFYVFWHYIGNVYRGIANTTRIDINYSSLSNIIRFGNAQGVENITPLNFDITDLSPLEAVDKIVKAIPGMWYWRLIYFPKSVMIDIQCNSDPSLKPYPKSLFIGTGAKINDKSNNNVNVESCKVVVSAKNSISHAVAVGGAIEIETSIQYLPAWPQYLRPVTDFSATFGTIDADVTDNPWTGTEIPSGYYVCDFKGWTDFNLWKQFIKGDLKGETSTSKTLREEITRSDEKRYSQIYRVYVFPENASQILKSRNIFLTDFLPGYEDYISYVHELLFKNVLRIRTVKNPLTDYREIFNYARFQKTYDFKHLKRQFKKKAASNPPFVFMYDSLISTAKVPDAGGLSTARKAALLKSKQWIIPQEDKGNGYSLEQDNKVLLFQNPQYERKTISALITEETSFPNFLDVFTRRIFVTCRIECDVPLIQDRILNRSSLSNARLVTQSLLSKDIKGGEVAACIRTNAYFPSPFANYGTNVTLTQGTDQEQVDDIDGTELPAGDDAIFGSKIINWNFLDGIRNDANLIQDDSHILREMIKNFLEYRPLYDISLDAGLGTINASYLVGDRIDRIIGSELADGTGGYYNLDCIIERLSYEAVGESDGFKTKMQGRNNLPVSSNFLVRKKE